MQILNDRAILITLKFTGTNDNFVLYSVTHCMCIYRYYTDDIAISSLFTHSPRCPESLLYLLYDSQNLYLGPVLADSSLQALVIKTRTFRSTLSPVLG